MFRVLIVEDEIWIAALIRSILTDGLPDVQIAGEAKNGQEALDMITELHPDIVLTDINLPIMSGLDVIQKAREDGYEGKIVVISGYNDFNYAQQALRCGVTDYLLKPVDDEELCQVVSRIMGGLRADSEAAQRTAWNDDVLKGQFLDCLMMKDFLPMTVCDQIYSLHFTPGIFCCAAVRLHSAAKAASQPLPQAKLIERSVFEKLSSLCSEAVSIIKGNYLVFLFGCPHENAMQMQSAFDACFHSLLYEQKESDIQITISLSKLYDDFPALQSACRQAVCAVFSQPKLRDRILYLADADAVLLRGPEPQKIDTASLKALLLSQQYDAISEWLCCRLTDYARQRQILDDEFFLLLPFAWALMDTYLQTVSAQFPKAAIRCESFLPQLKNCMTVKRTQRYFAETAETVCGLLSAQQDDGDHTISRIKAYVAARLSEPISLNEAADLVHLTPSYLSEYFKNKTQMNFKDYVLEQRMERAKYLLRKGIGVQEAAAQCGYSDVKYFCKVFKKISGITPSEYRRIYGR